MRVYSMKVVDLFKVFGIAAGIGMLVTLLVGVVVVMTAINGGPDGFSGDHLVIAFGGGFFIGIPIALWNRNRSKERTQRGV